MRQAKRVRCLAIASILRYYRRAKLCSPLSFPEAWQILQESTSTSLAAQQANVERYQPPSELNK
ncbi:hypothetical protein O9992_00460 [Vibrio lentus]|nr:hypothetical protein [Vibrio lentus]